MRLAVAILATLGVLPAQAGWRQTEWGESLAAVRAVLPAARSTTAATRRNGAMRLFGVPMLVLGTTADGAPATLSFYFADGKLTAVKMTVVAPTDPAKLDGAAEWLLSQYGSPVHEDRYIAGDCATTLVLWRDVTHDMLVSEFAARCIRRADEMRVFYAPISTAETDGY
ncbi:hypothetical protein LQ948_16165 [Jiella sp. MQZ9-1]|uniref:Uncharacterized protein n=1 Tax=Jiella flava TaxID=2816857 RepID=A0A939FYZ7_9HYPH|nr:hypothetical protein [Jiella flava]MBO0664170.1 hypothetical protein [Jiella flava]MCD2472742.1 hypothetical protein [Jiella flava]